MSRMSEDQLWRRLADGEFGSFVIDELVTVRTGQRTLSRRRVVGP